MCFNLWAKKGRGGAMAAALDPHMPPITQKQRGDAQGTAGAGQAVFGVLALLSPKQKGLPHPHHSVRACPIIITAKGPAPSPPKQKGLPP